MPAQAHRSPAPFPETRLSIPLQTGTSALREMLFGSVISTVMLAFCALGMGGAQALEVVPIFGAFVAIGPLLGGLVALQRRAVDLELRQSEFIVRGGRLDGRTVRYADIDPKSVEVVREEPTTDGGSSLPYARLDLYLRDGTFLRLANIMDYAEERLFLNELRGIILELAAPSEPLPLAGVNAADMGACGSCGGPLVPQDVPSVTCPSCHQPADMPQALLERIRGNRAVRVFDDKTLTIAKSLIRQPRARAINFMLVAFIAVVVAASFFAVWGIAAHHFSVVFVSYACVHGLYALIRLVLTQRVGVRALVLAGKGRRQVGSERLPACRNCGGLLPPDQDGDLLVRCTYCAEISVLAFDLPWHREQATGTREGLGAALWAMTEARQRCFRRLVLVGLVLVVSVPFLFAPPW